ncbi:MAG: hypothetical protein M3O88_09790, partial [Actinomycetota bacterium]|nr:hypothetical protein [Actinomycetota bacterium]
MVSIGPNNAWAVGSYWKDGAYRGLTEHWDGSVWSVVRTPHPHVRLPGPRSVALNDSPLYSIDAAASNDVWAVGSFFDGHQYQAQAEHWNGMKWRLSRTPERGALLGVSARSSRAWAVGSFFHRGGYRN